MADPNVNQTTGDIVDILRDELDKSQRLISKLEWYIQTLQAKVAIERATIHLKELQNG